MARRLVLNGLTAEVLPTAPLQPVSPDSLDCYHEYELYRQLLALPPEDPTPKSQEKELSNENFDVLKAVPSEKLSIKSLSLSSVVTVKPPLGFGRRPKGFVHRRARTPSPVRIKTSDGDHTPRRARTPAPRKVATSPVQPLPPCVTSTLPQSRHAKYLGSFAAESTESDHATRANRVSAQLHLMTESGREDPVVVVIALSGVQICDPLNQEVRMTHALRRISYATCESARALFAFVAREPRPSAHHFCHAFKTDTPQQAEELNSLVGDAFRMAFASQLQPSAPLWSKELSGSECGMRAPDSLPGLTHHYPRCLSPPKCDIMGASKLVNEPSPSSSEDSSPTEVVGNGGSYRRLGDRPPLMKRLGFGFSGNLLNPSDDDSTPLVADTPTTPTNVPLCLNGGYINEASEAEARTRESNREPPRRLPENPTVDLDTEFRKCNNIKNSCPPSATCSRTTSSSSGGSSCGASHCLGNNNPRVEPELRQAPWFQQGIPREIALEVLSGQPVGAFLVRGSTTQPACYALSVRVPKDFQPSGIAHYLILRTQKGYKIKGFTKEFTSLTALVTHHSVMPELLPVPLRLARPMPNGGAARAARRREHADIETVSQHTTPHSTPHRMPNFLTQLDV